MHLKRWLTGIIAVPVLIFLVGYAPAWVFHSALCAASLIGLIEYYTLTNTKLPKTILAFNIILTVILFLAIEMRQVFLIPAIILFWALVPMTVFMFTFAAPNEKITSELGKSIFGPVYVTLPLALLALIHFRAWGSAWIFFLLAVVFAGDTGAFYTGKLFGKHKLHKRISPGKTWEGAVGGLGLSLAAGVLFLLWIPVHPLNVNVFVLLILLSAAEQIGDLGESLLKRNHGIKDSGHFLPGHGGILDRIDGLLFAIPVLFVYLFWS
ncbi:MAG: phosphatidate cytidylyltransferase [Desulfatiglandaceae bacterium]